MSDEAEITVFGNTYRCRLTLPVLDAYEREFQQSFMRILAGRMTDMGVSQAWFLVREAVVRTGGGKRALLQKQYSDAGAFDSAHILAAMALLIESATPDEDDVGESKGAGEAT